MDRAPEEIRSNITTTSLHPFWTGSPDLLVVLDGGGRIVDANPAWTRLLGWAPDALTGSTFESWTDDGDGIDRLSLRVERRMRRRDGGVAWFSWSVAHEHGLRFATGRDLGFERQAAAVLATTREQLRQSQKMETVGQLTGGLVHDFNNLLTAIGAGVEMAQRRIAHEEFDRVAAALTTAQAAVTRAAILARRLCRFARQEDAHPRITDLNDVVGGVAELIRRTRRGDVQLVVDCAEEACRAIVEANQFENALLNLCNNANDAMPTGGSVTIVTRRAAVFEHAAALGIAPGRYVAVDVIDTGTGIPAAIVDRVFDPFFTTKSPEAGTGLGLAMVRDFARQSSGAAEVASSPGQGTTMTLYLPEATFVDAT